MRYLLLMVALLSGCEGAKGPAAESHTTGGLTGVRWTYYLCAVGAEYVEGVGTVHVRHRTNVALVRACGEPPRMTLTSGCLLRYATAPEILEYCAVEVD